MNRAQRIEKQQEIETRNSIDDLTEHEAWSLVLDMVQLEVTERTDLLIGAAPNTMTLEQSAYLRGQLNAFNWLLGLKADNRIQRDTLKQEIEEEEEDA